MSIVFISLENLAKMRPIGVTSKKAKGIRIILCNSKLCNTIAAFKVALVNIKFAKITVITEINVQTVRKKNS